MNNKIEEKSLIDVKNKGIFYKIKNFFKNLFHKNINIENNSFEENTTEKENKKNTFEDSLKDSLEVIDEEKEKLLNLQQQYRNGEIKEEEMTKEQIEKISALYDEQISKLRESNEKRKQKILEYRKKFINA